MAVQSSPSQQPLADHLRMGRNVNAEILSMSALKFYRRMLVFNYYDLAITTVMSALKINMEA